MILTKALATAGDATGGYDGTSPTKLPGTYLAYPLKSWEDQTHDGAVTLEAYDNFANVIIAPEGLELDYVTWKPLGAGNDGTDLNQDGTVDTAAHNAEECTTLNKSEFQGKLGPYNTALTNPADDVFRSSNPDLRSSAKKTDVPAGTYPSVNANPFFPSTGGTHKPIADEENDIKGTQPGLLDANAVYAGAYSEYSKGAVDPGGTGAAARDYRFFIQNDQKWIYASPSGVDYKTPNATDIKDQMHSTNLDGGMQSLTAAAAGCSANLTIPQNVPGTCTTAFTHDGNYDDEYDIGATGGFSNMAVRKRKTCVRTGGCSGGSSTGNETTSTACGLVGGTWSTPSVSWSSAVNTEVTGLYNSVQHMMTSAGGILSTGSTSNAWNGNFKILYDLLLNLTSASYGEKYVDPNEPSAADNYTEVGRGDVSFRTAVKTMKTKIDDLITAHNTQRTNINNHAFSSASYPTAGAATTAANAYKTEFDEFETHLAVFRNAIKYRIREISNRIGYLNGKNTAVGGQAVSSQVADVTVGAAGSGFTGYAFNGGNGYANTIFSHANFLAGKKIKLFGKILAAIADVETIYDQIKSKRAEYYEYNQ